jgi:cystathionine beta-lyase/cystathionine gamma-synthase
MNIQTACIHGSKDDSHGTGAICTPIYQSATFAHRAVGESTGYDYSRESNPTRSQLEGMMARLEGGTDALAFSSGMAAIGCLMETLAPGDHVIASEDLYGGTVRLFDSISAKNGVDVTYADTGDLDAVSGAISGRTRLIFVETPSNPMMRITDIRALRALLGGRDILLAVDNTFLTPYFCNPLELGADVVVHSGTKYLGGHNDTLAGFLVVRDPGFADALRKIATTTGAALPPFDAFLIMRGIKTLAIRMDRAQGNARALADWLKGHPKVRAVHYVGMEDHPGFSISQAQTRGFGSMISFEVDSRETALAVLNGVSLILFAESLGGVETLITYPLLQTHADVPEEKRQRLGINDRLLRISVGIEHPDDLLADLAAALA